MPRVRRRGHKERTILTRAQKEQLLFGGHILNAWPGELFQTEEEKRAAWQAHKVELLAEFRTDERNAGAACYGQFVFDQGHSDAEFWQQRSRERSYEAEQAERLARIEARKKGQTDGTSGSKPN